MHTIGVLDSGIGGLTTCCAIFKCIPTINVIYRADNLNAPYGTKGADEVYYAVRAGVQYLLSRKAEAIVLACNTATAVCIERLRAEFDVPFIGTEPAVKQAIQASGKTLYLATELTARQRGSAGFQTVDTSSLATLIENLFSNKNVMAHLTAKVISSGVDNVIIGCTHYTYLVPYIEKYLSSVTIFDGAQGVARQTARIIKKPYSLRGGKLFLTFSGKQEYTKYFAAYYSFFEICKY